MPDETAPAEAAFLSVDEAAALLAISTKTAYKLCDSGEIPSTRVGGQLRIPRSAIDELLVRAEREAAERQRDTAAS